jgi:thiol:disulfide interchange protein
LDAVTLSNDQVKAHLADRFELVRLEMHDGDAAQDAAIESLGVGAFPAVLVLDSQGVERHRVDGFVSPDEFLGELEEAEAELARATGDPVREAGTSGGG